MDSQIHVTVDVSGIFSYDAARRLYGTAAIQNTCVWKVLSYRVNSQILQGLPLQIPSDSGEG